jgi:polyhydroxybutyrate depolymerase
MPLITRKLLRIAIGISVLFIPLLIAQRSFGNAASSITVDGHNRTYELHVPAAYKRDKAVPLVVALHGRGGTGHVIVGLTHFDSVADAHGFLVVYPDGLSASWADGRGATPSDTGGIDDVKFISELIRKLARDYKIDSLRVFVTGYSNGGFMSQRVACELSSQVAAVGVVAATMGEITASHCHPDIAISVMLIQGTKDPLVPFQGGPMGPNGSRGMILSLQEAGKKWIGLDGCDSKPEITTLQDKAVDGTSIRREAFAGCKGGAEVIVYTVEGGGHTWPGGKAYLPESVIGKTSGNMDASEALWEFFSKHSRP